MGYLHSGGSRGERGGRGVLSLNNLLWLVSERSSVAILSGDLITSLPVPAPTTLAHTDSKHFNTAPHHYSVKTKILFAQQCLLDILHFHPTIYNIQGRL